MEKRKASEQVTMIETITKVVEEAMRVAIQAMVATTERPECGRTQDRQPCHEAAHIQLGDRRQI